MPPRVAQPANRPAAENITSPANAGQTGRKPHASGPVRAPVRQCLAVDDAGGGCPGTSAGRWRAPGRRYSLPAMHLGVSVPVYGPGTDPGVLREWARLVEGLGFDLLMVSDHVVITPDVAVRYPERFFEPFT